MTELFGNIWDYHMRGEWIAFGTNGTIKKNGCNVMGRGVAQQCASKYPLSPKMLGDSIILCGNTVQTPFPDLKIFTFPVKHQWFDGADIGLIEQSAYELVAQVSDRSIADVFLTRPGCGNGGLNWADVHPVLAPILDDRFHIVELPR